MPLLRLLEVLNESTVVAISHTLEDVALSILLLPITITFDGVASRRVFRHEGRFNEQISRAGEE